jgi:hypothetical protein
MTDSKAKPTPREWFLSLTDDRRRALLEASVLRAFPGRTDDQRKPIVDEIMHNWAINTERYDAPFFGNGLGSASIKWSGHHGSTPHREFGEALKAALEATITPVYESDLKPPAPPVAPTPVAPASVRPTPAAWFKSIGEAGQRKVLQAAVDQLPATYDAAAKTRMIDEIVKLWPNRGHFSVAADFGHATLGDFSIMWDNHRADMGNHEFGKRIQGACETAFVNAYNAANPVTPPMPPTAPGLSKLTPWQWVEQMPHAQLVGYVADAVRRVMNEVTVELLQSPEEIGKRVADWVAAQGSIHTLMLGTAREVGEYLVNHDFICAWKDSVKAGPDGSRLHYGQALIKHLGSILEAAYNGTPLTPVAAPAVTPAPAVQAKTSQTFADWLAHTDHHRLFRELEDAPDIGWCWAKRLGAAFLKTQTSPVALVEQAIREFNEFDARYKLLVAEGDKIIIRLYGRYTADCDAHASAPVTPTERKNMPPKRSNLPHATEFISTLTASRLRNLVEYGIRNTPLDEARRKKLAEAIFDWVNDEEEEWNIYDTDDNPFTVAEMLQAYAYNNTDFTDLDGDAYSTWCSQMEAAIVTDFAYGIREAMYGRLNLDSPDYYTNSSTIHTEPRKNMTDTKKTKTQQLRAEANDAAWFVAASQANKVAQKHLTALLLRELGDESPKMRAKVARFMKGDLGQFLTAIILSIGVDAGAPFLAQLAGGKLGVNQERLERLATALRVSAMATGGLVLTDKFMGPLTNMTAEMLRGVPTLDVSDDAPKRDIPRLTPKARAERVAESVPETDDVKEG